MNSLSANMPVGTRRQKRGGATRYSATLLGTRVVTRWPPLNAVVPAKGETEVSRPVERAWRTGNRCSGFCGKNPVPLN